MNRILISCAMLEDEVKKVYDEQNCQIPIVWMERGYHNTPKKLKEELQKQIDRLQEYDEILLTFGLCGNGTEGIISPSARLIMPRFDDCINMLLCRGRREHRGLAETGSIYLTRGWTLESESILSQYDTYLEEYGEETAEEIMEMMYEHYESISLIDTKCYDLAPVQDYAKKAGDLLGLSSRIVEGSTELLRQLLLGQWDENFLVLEPGQPVKAMDFEFPEP